MTSQLYLLENISLDSICNYKVFGVLHITQLSMPSAAVVFLFYSRPLRLQATTDHC